jgi:hypothetical protein
MLPNNEIPSYQTLPAMGVHLCIAICRSLMKNQATPSGMSLAHCQLKY